MPTYHDPFHSPTWTQDDAQALREFLLSDTGKRFIFRLQNDRPGMPASKEARHSMEGHALWASAAHGYETAVRRIFEYLNAPVEASSRASVYPSLDDDAQWAKALQPPDPLKSPLAPAVPNEAEIDLDNPPKPQK